MKSRETQQRELAWTVAGAAGGSLLRYWVSQMWPATGGALAPTRVLQAAAAVFIGFALVAPIPTRWKTVIIAAGGAIASISAVATEAASATPTQSVIGLIALFVLGVAGLALGMLVALSVLRNAQREEWH